MGPIISEKSLQERVYDHCTPIFDRETGDRMKVARMKLLLDQAELGKLLGCSQNVISRLENGSLKVHRVPFTMTKFREVFGKLWTYVLLGNGAEDMPTRHIHKTYWDTKLAPKKGDKRVKHWMS